MPQARVRQFMNEAVLTVTPEGSLADVATRMRDVRASCAVVCAPTGVPLGVLTRSDLSRALNAGGGHAAPAGSAMSLGVFALTADAPCTEALRLMSANAVANIVVVDANNIVTGILSRDELLHATAAGAQVAPVPRDLASVPAPDPWESHATR